MGKETRQITQDPIKRYSPILDKVIEAWTEEERNQKVQEEIENKREINSTFIYVYNSLCQHTSVENKPLV